MELLVDVEGIDWACSVERNICHTCTS